MGLLLFLYLLGGTAVVVVHAIVGICECGQCRHRDVIAIVLLWPLLLALVLTEDLSS